MRFEGGNSSRSKPSRTFASELGMNHGKRPQEVGKQEMQRAKRELLRLQTFPSH